jgi:hypothetical protein
MKRARCHLSNTSRAFAALVVCALLVGAPPVRPAAAQSPAPAPVTTPAARDGSHDFDFEFGSWKMHLARLLHPLTGSTTWVAYDGTSVVRKVWDGRANLGEIELDGPAGHIEGLSLRLYDPAAHQWGLSFSNSRGGGLGPATVGGFKDGRGEFYDQETLDGHAIFVRFVFSNMTPASFRIEQAFSADGGQTWETNWISTFTRA